MQSALSIQQNVNLKHFNTFGVAVNARYFAAIHNTDEMLHLLSQPHLQAMPCTILGEGSNVLLIQNYDGLIIKNNIKGMQIIFENEDYIDLKIGGGENWHQLVMYCIQHHYAGIENLSLIPGTVGAAPIQNIGAYGVELKDTLVELTALHLKDCTLHSFTRQQCQFDYRDSVFKTLYKNQFAIVAVTLRLLKKPVFHIEYGNIQETLNHMGVKELTLRAVSDAIIAIRRSKLPDPAELGNAGSFFKNPLITSLQLQTLQQHFPTIPSFKTDDPAVVKISAAWLIEQAGWKGKRVGNVGVYAKQALILVNYGNGTGEELLKLAQDIQTSVHEKFNVMLTPEVNFIT